MRRLPCRPACLLLLLLPLLPRPLGGEVYEAPDELVRWGLTPYGMGMYVFNAYDDDRDGTLDRRELAALQHDTNPELPLTEADHAALVRAFGGPITAQRFLSSYAEPWRSLLGTDAQRDFAAVFALLSRATRVQ